MRARSLLGGFFLDLPLIFATFLQQNPAPCRAGQARGRMISHTPDGEAKILGTPFRIPALQVRLVNSNGPVAASEITVCYDWKWFRYPYPKKVFGAWETSYECFSCTLGQAEQLKMLAHTVQPRGWYRGWRRWGRKPQFVGLRFGWEVGGELLDFSHLGKQDLQSLVRGRRDFIPLSNRKSSLEIRLDGSTAP